MSYTNGLDKPSDYFNTVTYSGNGSTQSITGVGFQPDFIWGKGRTLAGYNHGVVDIVRGTGKNIYTNLTQAEETYSTGITSFDSDGFSVGSGNVFNNGSNTYVAWNWLADNTSGSSNTDGSITSTVSANTTSGFSIATWVGTGSNASVGHGLGGVDFMIIKDRDNVRNWYTWNKTFAYNDRIKLDTTDAKETSTDNMTALPDSTKINMSTSTQNNGSGINYVGYFFQEKKGFSKFGSYTGNGSSDGTFIYTGFKPAWVMIRRTNSTGDWFIYDNKRDLFNPSNLYLSAGDNGAEAPFVAFDMLSNGIKLKTTYFGFNGSGDSYIYMCFSENPFVTSTGIPTPAR